MAKHATVKYRRKREGRTYYKRRLGLLKSGKPRLVIRRTNSGVIVQIASYHPDGDKIMTTFHSRNISSYGWKYSTKSIPACYLAGMVVGASIKNSVSELVPDIGLQSSASGTRLYAVIKGVIDAGVKVDCSPSAFPDDKRIKGEHLADNKEFISSMATGYKKKGLSVEEIPSTVETIKKKILSM
ncbi:MAG: 50S ribosomal protein L18 [Nanobdellota archaeon]